MCIDTLEKPNNFDIIRVMQYYPRQLIMKIYLTSLHYIRANTQKMELTERDMRK